MTDHTTDAATRRPILQHATVTEAIAAAADAGHSYVLAVQIEHDAIRTRDVYLGNEIARLVGTPNEARPLKSKPGEFEAHSITSATELVKNSGEGRSLQATRDAAEVARLAAEVRWLTSLEYARALRAAIGSDARL